ncbi:MAG: outer membrane protein assembly factor BamD [Planctomycetota bacterium]
MLKPLWQVLLLAVVGAPSATAQSPTFEFDDDTTDWVPLDPPEPGSDAAIIADARRLIASDEPKAARRLINEWLDANERTSNPWLADAYLTRGDALVMLNREFKALYDYETIITDFPESSAFIDALERELEIGTRYLNGLNRRWFGLFRIEDGKPVGEELLVRIQERVPGSALAEQAAITLADFYYQERDLALAAEQYDIFVENFPESDYLAHAMERRVLANVGRFKGPRYNGAGLIEARVLLDEYRDRFPLDAEAAGLNEALSARLEESSAAQMLRTAEWYLDRGDAPASRITTQRLLRMFPRTASAQRGLEMAEREGWTIPPSPAVDNAAQADTEAQDQSAGGTP